MKNFQIFARAAVDAVERAEAELARVRAEQETAQADTQRLGREWLFAPSQAAAEEIDRARVEAARINQRAAAQIPEIERELLAARAEKEREALGRHHKAIAACVPKLAAAVEAAAAVQVEAILLRQAAVKELGEGLVQAKIPVVAFLGMLLPDLVKMWAQELRRSFNPPPAPPAPVSRSTAAKANGHAKPPATIPAPARPKRAPRADAPAQSGEQATVVFLRGGVELPDGQQAIVGDRITMATAQAQGYALRGVAEIVR
jgi:hypothetical protein